MHVPVLLKEAVGYLNPQPNQHVIDCTVGGGGHAAEILERTGPKGRVLGLDWDLEATVRARENLKRYGNRAVIRNENFAGLKEVALREGFGQVHGILFDLGMSSDQLEESGRGFSFRKTEPLDMRQNTENPSTAAKLLNFENRHELALLLQEYGEERYAWQIAGAIVQERAARQLKTTADLVRVIAGAVPGQYRRQRHPHFAQRTFQALRIAVNQELENLQRGLPQAADLLALEGRLVVISFHSLEDRIVKNFLKETPSLTILTKKPVGPSLKEVRENPRASAAKLRAAQKH